MSMNTRAHTAIVTGGSKGIGLAIAEAFAASGHNVVISGRDTKALAEAEKRLTKAGGGVMVSNTDVRDYAAVEKAIAKTIEHFGKIDIVVNGAAGNFLAAADQLSQDQPSGATSTIPLSAPVMKTSSGLVK